MGQLTTVDASSLALDDRSSALKGSEEKRSHCYERPPATCKGSDHQGLESICETRLNGARCTLAPAVFHAMEHEEGISPAWPFSYDELEPWYAQAESL